MDKKLRDALAEERKAGFAAIVALQTQVANLRESKKKLEAEMEAELNELRSAYAELVDAAKPVVAYWDAQSKDLTTNARANFWLWCGAGEKHCTAEDLDKLRELVRSE